MKRSQMPNHAASKGKWRRRVTAALRNYFERRSYPRTMLGLLLLLAGATGFLVSYGLLHLGIDQMWMRYPIAVLAAYAVLLALVRGWVELERRDFDPDDPAVKAALSAEDRELELHYQPASRWWDWLDVPNAFGFDGDEGCLPLLLVGALVVLLIAVVVAVIGAPALIAEVFLDAFLVSVLYRRLRIAEREHWLGTAIRKTWVVALVAAAALAVGGWALEQFAPGARSIGKAVEQLTAGEEAK